MPLAENPDVERFLRRIRSTKQGSTPATRESDIGQFAEWYDGDDPAAVTWRDVEDYLLYLNEQGYSGQTVYSRYDSLSALFGYLAGKADVIEEDPTEDVDMSELTAVTQRTMKQEYADNDEGVIYILPEEKEALAEAVPAPQVRNELIVRLLWQTGLRKHELCNIELGDIDRDERSIEVHSNKTHEDRTVFYQPRLDLLLAEWIDNYRGTYLPAEDSEYVFITNRSERLSENRLTEMIRGAADDAGIQEPIGEDAAGNTRWRVTPHTLRHSHAMQAVRDGIQLPYLRKHMGHKDIETTKQYLEVSREEVGDTFARKFGASED